MSTAQAEEVGVWRRLPVLLRAIVSGLLVFAVAANLWPLLLFHLQTPLAATVEAAFLALFCWWTAGGGSPRSTRKARAFAFRRGQLSRKQWFGGILAGLMVAVTVHACLFLLFRIVPFPREGFRQGYDLSFIPSVSMRWLAVLVSAASAAVCEETGFRGYMQRPIEQRFGAPVAILVSALFFTAVHLSKAWALAGMVPIVLVAGVMLGILAWSSGSLVPGMIGHWVMDVGLFAYWWTGIAGNFSGRPIAETGFDPPFFLGCVVLAVAVFAFLFASARLRRNLPSPL